MPNLYDSAFRTEIIDCPQFLLPLLNEVFGEKYTGNEIIEFHPNEHFIDKTEDANQERITDTNFTVHGTEKKEYHIECESSNYSSKILVRIFEYDAQIALDHSRIADNSIRVSFPNTAVLCLRNTKNTPDNMNIIIEVPGNSVSYEVPLIRMSDYTAKSLFEKKLYILIPFYIFNFEKKFKKCSKDDDEYEKLKQEFQYVSSELKRLSDANVISAYERRIIEDLSERVVDFIAVNHEKVRKGLGDIMRGPVIELEVDKYVKSEHDKLAKAQAKVINAMEEANNAKAEADKAKAEVNNAKAEADKAKAEADKARKESQKAIAIMRSLGISEEKIQSVYCID